MTYTWRHQQPFLHSVVHPTRLPFQPASSSSIRKSSYSFRLLGAQWYTPHPFQYNTPSRFIIAYYCPKNLTHDILHLSIVSISSVPTSPEAFILQNIVRVISLVSSNRSFMIPVLLLFLICWNISCKHTCLLSFFTRCFPDLDKSTASTGCTH